MLYLADETPTAQQLLSFVIPHVAQKWYEIGVMLLAEKQKSQLEHIRYDHCSDIKRCCSEMFDYWRRSHPQCNWCELVEALKSPGVELHAFAEKIENKFAGKLVTIVHVLCVIYETAWFNS